MIPCTPGSQMLRGSFLASSHLLTGCARKNIYRAVEIRIFTALFLCGALEQHKEGGFIVTVNHGRRFETKKRM